MTEIPHDKLTAKDLKSDQRIRWCPGCGDTAILNAVQKAMAEIGRKREDYVVISGIGCSSRFPYYMNTYGFHGIHGRAAAIASGVKVANPHLSVWQISGDGDAMAIGGNHLIHAIRRNIDMNIIIFNNEIYGLTKGQYSPTSKLGKVTKSSPYGTFERPFHPGELAIGAQGTFFARSTDQNVKLTTEILIEAEKHRGTSIVEILQNCVIFNDGTHSAITDKAVRDDRQVVLKHGDRLVFGKNKEKGIICNSRGNLMAVTIGENGVTEEDVLQHDAHMLSPTQHFKLINMGLPHLPVALGVIRAVPTDTYEQNLERQIDEIQKKSKIKTVDDLLFSGSTWEVE